MRISHFLADSFQNFFLHLFLSYFSPFLFSLSYTLYSPFYLLEMSWSQLFKKPVNGTLINYR